MDILIIFRIGLILISLLLFIIRWFYVGSWQALKQKKFPHKPRLAVILPTWCLGAIAIGSTALYIISPESLSWLSVSLPVSLRWSGFIFGAITIALFYWSHHSLGKNWSMPVLIQEGQRLVVSGPYRWVRHPMYTTFFFWAVAYFLITANAFVGVAWFSLAILSASMVPMEEAALSERFGSEYRSYMLRTGRFLPRIKPTGQQPKPGSLGDTL